MTFHNPPLLVSPVLNIGMLESKKHFMEMVRLTEIVRKSAFPLWDFLGTEPENYAAAVAAAAAAAVAAAAAAAAASAAAEKNCIFSLPCN